MFVVIQIPTVVGYLGSLFLRGAHYQSILVLSSSKLLQSWWVKNVVRGNFTKKLLNIIFTKLCLFMNDPSVQPICSKYLSLKKTNPPHPLVVWRHFWMPLKHKWLWFSPLPVSVFLKWVYHRGSFEGKRPQSVWRRLTSPASSNRGSRFEQCDTGHSSRSWWSREASFQLQRKPKNLLM